MVEKINKKNLNNGCTVPNYLYKDRQVRYYDSPEIRIAFSGDGKKWEDSGHPVLKPRETSFDSQPLTVIEAVLTTAGIMVFYDSSFRDKGKINFRVGLAFFDPEDPTKLIERNNSPIYQHELKMRDKIVSVKALQDKEDLVITWKTGVLDKIEVRIPHPYIYLGERNGRKLTPVKKQFEVNRYENNPIIKPQEENEWETKATFNPAALLAGDKIHLLYRAIGYDDVSVLGYASSEDGFNIKERFNYPVFLNNPKEIKKNKIEKFPISYISGGGGNGGCEDPRLTLIDDVVYLTYTAFDGWGSLRMALSSLSLKDFLNKEWNWEEPVMISPSGEIHKNWVLFPEKINGKFAVLHSVNPDILIDYLDNLDFKGEDKCIQSFFSSLKNKGRWDSWVRGVGPPPIKTEKGWLLIYHAMDVFRDPNRYKLGVMLLDLNDPQKIIARSKEPILEPDESYENDGWKAGVAYCCGAVVKEGQLLIYYGGADTVSCVAETDLKKFIETLVTTEKPKIKRVKRKKLNKL
ncbi:hypothetical protein COU49_00870 [Candidatus Nomurabacteria bacterium CG10_big_fil_rev_8_21_14_0_10_35_16]|uniref:Glycosidase n=1 Tax=Candidatus Nomurabacteria bacterium CG10_big_fil_rev_8_21_14_0_10_35_16 TaxID=1974731 RepID=A0A2H0TBW1_9BACT|nr:MAG: hypothetical protein COU49_00870 [Candidatus Nomurabacteria bacterium CG10_big_fil_rev_8_21_14_0_10_35_16]